MQKSEPVPAPLDAALGRRIRQRRRELGMSQIALGEAVGVSFQQIQKYEQGYTSLNFPRIVEISRGLKWSVSQLVQDLDEEHDDDDAYFIP